jgi:hypothetical protein
LRVVDDHLLSAGFEDTDREVVLKAVDAAIESLDSAALGDLLARLAEKYPSGLAAHPCHRCGAPSCSALSAGEASASEPVRDVMIGRDEPPVLRACPRCTALLIVMLAGADR